ncbi:hypothetical protein CHS0354_042882 [Potamilus streckersoni]|uniref:Glycosyltransferase family 92 protein n=1 Tax=Potamilus streckersoni TaxID=2493646 RepID=A0AAE0T509_9BIVA|nr:hypothetical protein CHS0354_042882 [Potamilus streckersoni]
MKVKVRCLILVFLGINVCGFFFILRTPLSHMVKLPALWDTLVLARIISPEISKRQASHGSAKMVRHKVLYEGEIFRQCTNITIPLEVEDKQIWQRISSGDSMYVFSAFLDGDKVRCIGASLRSNLDNVFCYLHYHDSVSDEYWTHIVPGQVVFIPEDHGRRYTASFYLCPKPDEKNPYAISLVNKRCQRPLNIMKILGMTEYHKKRTFSVCVTPLNFRYDRAYEIVEWMALNHIYGADYFTFYNYSSADNVKKVIDLFSMRGLAETVDWKLPMQVDTWPPSHTPVEIHYFAQLAALNDCFYRNRFKSKYIVFIDLDEFIVPRSKYIYSWNAMLSLLPKSSVYQFRNTFFRKEWQSLNLSDPRYDDLLNMNAIVTPSKIDAAKKYRLVTLLKLQREDKILPVGSRSKQIVHSSAIETIGIHDVYRMKPNQTVHVVKEDVALLHHYRDWENPNDTTPRKNDYTMLKFLDKLIANVTEIWKLLPEVPLEER